MFYVGLVLVPLWHDIMCRGTEEVLHDDEGWVLSALWDVSANEQCSKPLLVDYEWHLYDGSHDLTIKHMGLWLI